MAEEVKPLEFDSENKFRRRNNNILDFIYKKEFEPPDWLENVESPFIWQQHIKVSETVTWNIPGKLCDYDNQGAFYGFEKFSFLLTMLCSRTTDRLFAALFSNKEGSGSEESVGENDSSEKEEDEYEPEKTYIKCTAAVDEMAANEGDVMYSRIGPAFQHVLQATRAHMLFLNGQIEESQEIARNIQTVDDLSQKCLAGIEGIKSKVIMSMYQDYKIVLPYLHKAMVLDPGFGYWPYLIGKVLRRARREFKEDMKDEEIDYFEKAVELERNPKFLVFLAQAYQEKALALIYSNNLVGTCTVNNLLEKSVNMFRECWSLKNDSAAISRRVGNGMLKMRMGYIDKTVAKEALLKSAELSPNEVTHIALGKFYYFHEQNDEKALEHFAKDDPGDFGTSEIIRLNLIRDPNYDPYDTIIRWLKVEDNAVKQYRSFCDGAWYFLIFKKDLETAVKYLWRVLMKDHKPIRTRWAVEFTSYAFCIQRPINLVEVLVNEILLLKEKNRSLPEEDQKDMTFLNEFFTKMLERQPDLINITPRPNMVEELKQEMERTYDIKRRKRYGFGRNQERNETSQRSPPTRFEAPGSWRNHGLSQQNDQLEPSGEGNYGGNRRYSQWNSTANKENNSRRSDLRNSFRSTDDRANVKDRVRSYSESQPDIGFRPDSARTADSRGQASNQNDAPRRVIDRDNSRREYNHSSNNRYDVTITDWRSENRRN